MNHPRKGGRAKARQQSSSHAASTPSDATSSAARKRYGNEAPTAKMERPVAPKKARLTDVVRTPQAKKDVMVNRLVTLSNIKSLHAAKLDDTREERKRSAVTANALEAVGLPQQVPDVFFPDSCFTGCQCRGPIQCSRECIAATHNEQYGWEHREFLREREAHYYPSDVDTAETTNLERLLSASGISPKDTERQPVNEWKKSMSWNLDDYMKRQRDCRPSFRRTLVDWMVELSEEYDLSDKTLHLAVTLVDCTLASVDFVDEKGNMFDVFPMDRTMLQCLGCACIWIAAKIEEYKEPTVDQLIYISDNIYRRKQLIDMEKRVLKTTKFSQPVTAAHFVNEFLLASESDSGDRSFFSGPAFHPVLRNMVDYLLELSLLSYTLVPTKPSLVAAAAVYLARATLGIREMDPFKAVDSSRFWTATLQHYTGYSVEELRDTASLLLAEQRHAEQGELKGVFKKYNKQKYMFVSRKVCLSHEHLDLNEIQISSDL